MTLIGTCLGSWRTASANNSRRSRPEIVARVAEIAGTGVVEVVLRLALTSGARPMELEFRAVGDLDPARTGPVIESIVATLKQG